MEFFNFNIRQKSIDSESVIRQEDRKTGRQEDRKTGRELWKEIIMNAGLETARWGIYGSLALLMACSESSTRVDQTTGSDGVKVETTGPTYRTDPLTPVLPDAAQNATPFTRTGTDRCLESATGNNKGGDTNKLSLCTRNPNPTVGQKIIQTNGGDTCPEIKVVRDPVTGKIGCMSAPERNTGYQQPLAKGIIKTNRGSTCFEKNVITDLVTNKTRCQSDPK